MGTEHQPRPRTSLAGQALRVLLVLVLLSIMAGCAQLPRHSVVEEPQEIAVVEPPPLVANGSIYQPDRGYQPLFEDRRPRRVGDILTIVLDEQVSASKNSSANAGRSGSASLELAKLPEELKRLVDYNFEASGENDFSGSGGAQANNSFTGTITVTVLDVLYNGNLQVRGEKQIAINQGTEYIRFSGTVDPRTISGQNTVPSTQVANARIEYVGDGYINEAQTMGWLQRFFLNVSPF